MTTSVRTTVLGHPLDPVTLDDAADIVLDAITAGRSLRVITLNPEIVVRAQSDDALRNAIDSADVVVADGVGIVWAARRTGVAVPGRVPGVELVDAICSRGGSAIRACLVGARPGIADRAGAVLASRFGADVVGTMDGYFGVDEEDDVVETIRLGRPNLVLAALGERQESFLARNAAAWPGATSIGVGGTLDVLAGAARRTPAWTRRLGLEWAWRVGLDPARWHRAPRLARFAWRVLRSAPRRSRAHRSRA